MMSPTFVPLVSCSPMVTHLAVMSWGTKKHSGLGRSGGGLYKAAGCWDFLESVENIFVVHAFFKKQNPIFVCEADLYILMLYVRVLVSLPCLIKRYNGNGSKSN